MNDLLQRLAAANPVPESGTPSIDDVWHKISELDAQARPPRRPWWRPRPGHLGRVVATSIAVAAPIVAVVAIAAPLLGAHHRTPPRATTGGGSARSTLDPAAQRVAARELAGRAGAVVALDPRTGSIRVMYGNPARGGTDPTAAAGASPAVGPAARVRYPPGAAFAIVTAAAGLDSGRYGPDSRISGRSPVTVAGVPIRNTFDQSLGPITLGDALSESVNTVFARVASTVGSQQMTASMRRFGFYTSPRLDSAADRVAPSGIRIAGRLVAPSDAGADLGRLAIGQGDLAVTPLQMAMVASAVADGGTLMAPHLRATAPAVYDHAIKASTARTLTRMLRQVVRRGTGTAADRPDLQIAGKTGTAGSTGAGRGALWFVGFAPASAPRIAIAVALGDVKGGYGGTDAAPIAARVIRTLLAERR